MEQQVDHILVVDDDNDIRSSLTHYLESHGFRVSAAANGDEVERVIDKASIDLMVLDIMMPGEDGLSICKRIHESRQLPIIFLTALADEVERIIGLELGADDYVTKPFNPRELLARIKTVLRRSRALPIRSQYPKGQVTFDRWVFDTARKEITGADGVAIRLSSGEHLVLLALIEHAGTTLSRDQLLDLTKGREAQLFERSIDNVISRLRKKIEIDPQVPTIIQTAWGRGYTFVANIEA